MCYNQEEDELNEGSKQIYILMNKIGTVNIDSQLKFAMRNEK